MNLSDAFPSRFLKVADLNPKKDLPLVINEVLNETVGQGADAEDKPVLYFRGQKKGFVLNKTNGNTIAEGYGEEMDDWKGKTVLLYAARTSFQGKSVPCIRVRLPNMPDEDASFDPEQLEKQA